MEFINQLKELEGIIERHSSLIEKEARGLISEYSISTAEKSQKEIEKIENDNRLLQIGIVGRVKAGKSSLLNALLFNGKTVLPKAATPMTAALTVISYGEKLSAEVEFFSIEDIENIKYKHQMYKKEFNELKEKKYAEHSERAKKKKKDYTKEELGEKAEKSASKEMKENLELSASYDQYERIKASGIDYTQLENSKVVPFDSLESLASDLGDYVGSDGNLMPFTKSVHIKIPLEKLKNIQIVDTPGINDPVVSREERTRDLLKFCDVIFIVSPAGQFMSNEDLELMDRITSKEGIRELFVIASKCDEQLYGSIKEVNGGNLHKAFDAITSDLATSLHTTLSNLKNTNPEVGNAYDKLIEQSKDSIIHSSGISLSIKEAYDNQSTLDCGEQHAWGMLQNGYPDYFSNNDKKLSVSNLDLLSNMEVINKAISDVQDQKDEILAKRKEEFIKAKTDSLNKYKKELLKFVELKIDAIKNSDIDELTAQRERLNHIKLTVSGLVDEEYQDLVDALKIEMRGKLKNEFKNNFKSTKSDIDGAEGTKTDTWEEEYGGFLGFFKKTRTRSNTYVTVRTGAVKNALSDLTIEIESSIENVSDQTVLSWRKSLAPGLLNVLRDNVDDEDLNPTQIRQVVRNVINKIDFPQLSYKDDFKNENDEGKESRQRGGFLSMFVGNSDSSLRGATGTLTGSSAEKFMDEAQEYLNNFKQRVNDDINKYLDDLITNLKGLNMSDELFSEYDVQLEELEKELENREITLAEYNKLKNLIMEV